jgi:hypothetical protein
MGRETGEGLARWRERQPTSAPQRVIQCGAHLILVSSNDLRREEHIKNGR